VHKELVYEVVRHAGGILIVGRDRLEHLTKFLGVTESVGSITGMFSGYIGPKKNLINFRGGPRWSLVQTSFHTFDSAS
jgi:hypothetical protein